MATVNLWDDNLRETSQNGYLELTYVKTYLVIMDNPTDSAFDVLAQSGLPVYGSSALTPGGNLVYVVSRIPRRQEKTQTNKKWLVDVTYNNNQRRGYLANESGQPVSNPVDAAKEVHVEYIPNTIPMEEGILDSVTAQAPKGHTGSVDIAKPPWLNYGTSLLGVTNSALDRVEMEETEYTERITVWRYELGWTNYKQYLGAVNIDSVSIEESDKDAVRFSESYDPQTLVMRDIIKQNFKYNGILYYRMGFVMEFNERGWMRSVADEGANLWYDANQRNPETGADYTSDELDLIEQRTGKRSGQLPITQMIYKGQLDSVSVTLPTTFNPDDWEMATTGVVLLNGHGNSIDVDSSATGWSANHTKFFLNWKPKKLEAFGPLNL